MSKKKNRNLKKICTHAKTYITLHILGITQTEEKKINTSIYPSLRTVAAHCANSFNIGQVKLLTCSFLFLK